MGLGIYMDDLQDFEDTGEAVKATVTEDFSPDFKNRSTIQTWQVGSATATVKKWVGETLVTDSAHEIYIINSTAQTAVITFSASYALLDDNASITIKAGETAHFYTTGIPLGGTLKMVVRKGSQDTRTTASI